MAIRRRLLLHIHLRGLRGERDTDALYPGNGGEGARDGIRTAIAYHGGGDFEVIDFHIIKYSFDLIRFRCNIYIYI